MMNADVHNLVLWEPSPRERILILAPHPDDETLATGGLIASTAHFGCPSKVRVVVVTNGDASYTTVFLHGSHLGTWKNFQRQAVLRQQESLQALAVLGLNPEQVGFWGFPDRGLASLWQGHWDTQHPYRSLTTGFDKSLQALNSPILPFSGKNLYELLEQEFSEFRPTVVIMPHPQDDHPDHSALACFTLRAMRQYHSQTHFPPPVLFAYWMWRNTKPWLRKAQTGNLAHLSMEENSFSAGGRCFILSPDVQAQKTRALQCYPSQKIAAGKLFREAAHRSYEIFTLLQLAR